MTCDGELPPSAYIPSWAVSHSLRTKGKEEAICTPCSVKPIPSRESQATQTATCHRMMAAEAQWSR
jgi:hypothetical protein